MRRFLYLLLFVLTFWVTFKHLRPVAHAQGTNCATDQTLGWHDCGSASQLSPICEHGPGTCGGLNGGDVYAFSGGTLDSTRNILLIYGGGHADGYDNTIYGVSHPVNGSTATASIISHNSAGVLPPSQGGPCVSPYYSFTGGATPASRHTYDLLTYIPSIDAFFNFTGNLCFGAVNDFWVYYFSGTPHWQYLNPTMTCTFFGGGPCLDTVGNPTWDPNNTFGQIPAGGAGSSASAHYDSATNSVWILDGYSRFWNYAVATHALTEVNGGLTLQATGGALGNVAAVDTKRHRLWVAVNGQIVWFDISSMAAASVGVHIVSPQPGGFNTGALAFNSTTTSSFYGHLFTWVGGNTINDYNPDTNVTTPITYPNGPPVGVAENTGITYGRFAYMPAVDAFTVNNGAPLDEFVIRISSSTPDTSNPTNPNSLTANAISSSQVNLAWTASTDNVAVAGYNIERCSGGGCSNFAQINTSGTSSFQDSGLTASTSYSYRVRAFDTSNNLSGYSNTASATTQAPDTTPPTAPSSLTATAQSSTQISLSWTASTDAVGVTRYRVERCSGGSCSSFAEITQINGAPPVTTYVDNTLTASTSYSYRVRANDIAGNLSSYSNTATDTTQAGPVNTMLVDWGATAGANIYGLAGWTTRLQAANTTNVGAASCPACSNGGGVTITTDGNGFNNFQGVSTGTAPHTFAPGDVIKVTWFNNNNGSRYDFQPLISFNGTSCPSCGGTWYNMPLLQLVTNTFGSTSYTVTGNEVGIVGATSVNVNVNGSQTNVVIADKMELIPSGSLDSTPPTNPSGLMATSISQSRIDLSWTGSTDAVGVTQYQIDRCSGGGCSNFAQVAAVNGAPPVTTFSDTGLATSTSYTYKVSASDGGGNVSGFSGTATATTLTNSDATPPTAPSALTATVISYRQINLSWTASTDNVGVTDYNIEACAGVNCSNFTQAGAVSGTPPITTFSGYIFVASTNYSLRVRADDAAGNFSAYSNVVNATTLGPGPIQVGNDKPYLTLAAGYAAAGNGDTVEVDYNTNTNPGTSYSIIKCITIRGVGPPGTRASFPWDGGSYNRTVANGGTGTNPIPNDKGIFYVHPNCVLPQLVTLEHLECSGAYGNSGNDACVRYDNLSDLTITDLYIHDNEAGILGGNTLADTITTMIQNSIIARNGSQDGSEHNVYIGEQNHLIFRYNKSVDSIVGHTLKSRARINEVYSNFLSTKDQNVNFEGSLEADFPCGGDIYFIGNVVEQGVNTSNSHIVATGEEPAGNCGGSQYVVRAYFINNTFWNYRGSGVFFEVFNTGAGFTFVNQNNVFGNGGTLYDQASPTLASNNNTTATSADFAASDSGNYRLVAGASEINAGTNPGSANGFSLTPTTIYLDPAMSDVRTDPAPPDVGAYGFNGAPTPGNAGNFGVTTNITQSSLTLNWTKGTDAVSPQNTLLYTVYKSTTNNIATVANMLANGTVASGPTADINTANISALFCGTTTFFNVLIQNQAGTQAAYNGTSSVTLGCNIHAGRGRLRK